MGSAPVDGRTLSLALLGLYFGGIAPAQDDIAALAPSRERAHLERLAVYEQRSMRRSGPWLV